MRRHGDKDVLEFALFCSIVCVNPLGLRRVRHCKTRSQSGLMMVIMFVCLTFVSVFFFVGACSAGPRQCEEGAAAENQSFPRPTRDFVKETTFFYCKSQLVWCLFSLWTLLNVIFIFYCVFFILILVCYAAVLEEKTQTKLIKSCLFWSEWGPVASASLPPAQEPVWPVSMNFEGWEQRNAAGSDSLLSPQHKVIWAKNKLEWQKCLCVLKSFGTLHQHGDFSVNQRFLFRCHMRQ